MKKSIRTSIALGAICALTALSSHAANVDAGFVDFGKFTPSGKGEFVEVNIKSNLITMVTNLAKKSEPEIAEVIGGLKQIRVNVLGVTDENKPDLMKRVSAIRADLDNSAWERLVTVMQKNEDVAVFVKMNGSEAIDGIAITVMQDKQLVLVNIVGDLRPEKISLIGERFDIEPLKKLHIPVGKRASK